MLREARPDDVTLETNDLLRDLAFLTDIPKLSVLRLSDCGGLVDYSALPGLCLDALTLRDAPSGP